MASIKQWKMPDGTIYDIKATYSDNSDKLDGKHLGTYNGAVCELVSFPSYGDMINNGWISSDYEAKGHPDEEYLQGLCKWAIANYHDQGDLTLMGSCNPNCTGTCILHLYSSSGYHNSTRLPRYCAGTYNTLGGYVYLFGTVDYSWYYRNMPAGNADTVDGYHVSGTWPISISGNAASASTLLGVSTGSWNPRGTTLVYDFSSGGGDMSISQSGGQISLSVDGFFYQNEGQYLCLDTNNYNAYAISREPWWNYSDSHNVDDFWSGTTFAYTTHNAPTTGEIVAFANRDGGSYCLQLQGSYGGEYLYFRNRNGDNGTWNTWRYMIHNGNIGSQSVSYANNSGNCDGHARYLLINGVTWDSSWHWSGQSGQPSWLWGSNDGYNMYVWNPSNFSVNYANYSGRCYASVGGTNSVEIVRCDMADNDQFRIICGGTGSNAGYVGIDTADDATEPIYVRQYTGVFSNLVRSATLLDSSGNTSFPGSVSANTFYTSNWFRTYGSCGWYSETYGGGIYMEDSTWIRTYNGKNFYCSATMGAGGFLYSDGDARISGNLTVSSNNATGGGIILSDDGDIVDMNDGYCSMRFSYGVRIFSGNRGGSPTITLYGPGGTVTGAVWNDYAEYRKSKVKEPGRCVYELGNDELALSEQRMMPGCEIVSDTFGFAIGETDECKTPIATSGRVLAYPYESIETFKSHIGKPVCSGPNGTVSIMTDEEYKEKGYCAIGTISAVPDYETWGTGNVKVDGRVWIRIR